jgi:hypothetical protein
VRLYSIAVTSLAIDAPVKWTDNLVSHFELDGVRSSRRGVARGVSWAGIVRIALIRALHQELGAGVRDAVRLADALLRDASGRAALGGYLSLAFDRSSLEQALQSRLVEALESAPRPRRGRPAHRPGVRPSSDLG